MAKKYNDLTCLPKMARTTLQQNVNNVTVTFCRNV